MKKQIAKSPISNNEICNSEVELLRAICNSIPYGLVISNLSGRIVQVNNQMSLITGYTSKYLLRTGESALFHNAELKIIREQIEAIEVGEQCTIEEIPIKTKNRKAAWISIDAKRIYYSNEERVIAYCKDVTDEVRMRNDDKEQYQSRRVQAILDKSAEISKTGTWELDITTLKLYWSEMTKKIHEVPLDYVPQLETAIGFYVEDSSKEIITEVVDDAINCGKQFDVKLEILTAKGNLKQVRAIGMPEIEEGEVVKLLGIFQDITDKKEAEIEFQKLASIVQNSADFIGIAKFDGTPLFLNKAGRELIGIETEEFDSEFNLMNHFDHVGQLKMQNVVLPEVMEKGRWAGEFEFKHLTTDEMIPVMQDIFRIDDPVSKKPICLATVTRDIRDIKQQIHHNETELEKMVFERTKELALANKELGNTAKKLKKAYDKLAKSESMFRLLTENANDLVSQYEYDTVRNKIKKLYSSPSLEKTLGYSHKEWAKKPAFYHVHPDEVESVRAFFNDAIIKRLQHATITVRFLNKNGEIVWLEGNHHFSYKEDGIVLISSVDRNITTQKLAEDQLLKSEQKYRFLAENSHDVVIAYNANLEVTYVSPAIYSLTGFTVEETISENGIEMIHPKDLPAMIKLFKQAVQSRIKDRIVRYRRKVKKGGYIWVETAVSFIYDNNNHFTNMIVNVRDISTQMKAEEDLASAQGQLIQAEKMASLGVLTAGIAHEINNPVNFVSAGINSLEDNLKDVKKVLDAYEKVDLSNAKEKLPEIAQIKSQLQYDRLLQFVDRSAINIRKGAERTSEIISSLRSFSRVDADEILLTDIHESLDNTLLLLKNQYKDHIAIVKHYDEIPKIECFSGKINQVFVNVLANAIQAIKKQGTITIATKKLKMADKDFVEITIKDTGEGIDDEMKKRIFEPFFTTKNVGEGTGLGLSISHGIIEKHSGTIEVKSEKGKYTTFSIKLPVNQ